MCKKKKITLFFLLFLSLQTLYGSRSAAVAGSFYSDDKTILKEQIKTLLQNSKSTQDIQAIVVPHAGYIYSAKVATKAYSLLHKKYKNIFIIGSSHSQSFDGASIYDGSSYTTPLGEVKINNSLRLALRKNSPYFSYIPDAHTKEHTIEVQLPFLQTIYGDKLSIVPIILGTQKIDTIKSIANTLKPYFNEENLFIISTDLSHYPAYNDANSVDKTTLQSLLKNSPDELISTIVKNKDKKIDNLHTSACGLGSLLTLLYLTKEQPYSYRLLDYKNSGDTSYGDKKRVVGYASLLVNKESIYLSKDDKKELLDIAKLALYDITYKDKKTKIDEDKVAKNLKQKLGVFVTLYKNGTLRGCIGTFEAKKPLYESVIDMAVSSAQNDTRFSKVRADELKDIDIEISVLTPKKEIDSLDEIVLGKHGIYIQKGLKHGTYLPHVAIDMGWNIVEFVGNCSKDKVKIGYDGYKDAKIYIYETLLIKDKNILKK